LEDWDLFDATNIGLQDWPKNYREQFWAAYPRKVEKVNAMKALDKVRKTRILKWQILIEAVKHYAVATHGSKYIKHPATWLNAGCWDDEPDAPRPQTFADIAMGK
jgi:hypothetical protein